MPTEPASSGEKPTASRPSLAAWLRALLLMVLVVLNTLATVPSFGSASAERLQRPFEQAELARWHALLGRLGLTLSRERLAELYLEFAAGMVAARAVVQAPLSWWVELTQTQPSWLLFGMPDAFSPAFRLQAWDSHGEQVLYESGNAERSWQAALLGYRRVRAAYGPSRAGVPPTYPGLCQRLSELAFAELPEVERVRCAIVRRAVAVPGQAEHREPEEQDPIEIVRSPG